MKTYARIQDGIVMEVIHPMAYDADSPPGVEPPFKAGDEVPITSRYNAALIDGTISTMVDVTSLSPMPGPGWTTEDGKAFSPPSS